MTAPNEEEQRAGAMPPGGEPTEELPAADAAELQAALEAAQVRALESRDLYLRALAELENVRKRAARDIEQAHRYAIDRFANDLIGVKDSLELGLVSTASIEALRAGTEATLRLLTKAFENAGLAEIVPEGQPFNPDLHEAIAAQPSDRPPNTVLQVVQRGYQLNGRLLRPARVIVSRESSSVQ
jgi:molecular chaperone GrpE